MPRRYAIARHRTRGRGRGAGVATGHSPRGRGLPPDRGWRDLDFQSDSRLTLPNPACDFRGAKRARRVPLLGPVEPRERVPSASALARERGNAADARAGVRADPVHSARRERGVLRSGVRPHGRRRGRWALGHDWGLRGFWGFLPVVPKPIPPPAADTATRARSGSSAAGRNPRNPYRTGKPQLLQRVVRGG